ncbi:Beta-ketothiolase BktB [Oligella urethralis]|uniref:Beta-ketothiolase BktB n=1 Tax=Oligella urethralis TaxID=90245 RepID=A0A2N6QA45_9BURK|nr:MULTISPECIES: acetyl-CoA C-acyltransferase family protein [Oligella]AVL71807.1 acetyl-CoA C-acyltransferase [Oligella urethralis]MDK6202537.1 acetyl-CoA C-acyltransferase family protein [Oligella urethralis]OFS83133.1 acetyl-CoA acetyltransferase [Oligella sp. HMSC05A10]OFV50426.1 acetyl-CoA acetyltransferase [Oligella sp. HMSC09E12]PMC16315.1 acetyl-CoA C-acyltransferase [Oligella urethralis]
MSEVYVVSAMRSAIGGFGGSLKDMPPHELGAAVIKAAIEKAGITGDDVNHVVIGHVINTEPRDQYLSRLASVNAGVTKDAPAMNVNRLCGSGLQAIVSAAQAIKLGDADVAIGGGIEVMSRGPYITPSLRWGARMGDNKVVDMMTGALTDPFEVIHMGVTAENVAKKYNITREEQDALAVESHRRARHAIENGYFKEQIVPITLKTRKGEVVFDTDEHARGDVTAEGLAKLRPVFVKENGTVTAGNASGINDGAAAVVLMSEEAVKKHGAKPLARLVAYAHAGVDPEIMGIGPVPASEKVLKKAGLSVEDMDVIEANEAFAAQALAVSKSLGLDPAKVNPNGSGVGLGHPIGATGAIITTKALHELHRIGGKYALVTMCIGGGQGISAIFERVE